MIFSFQGTQAQMNLYTEDFETDGEGTRYTSNSFDVGCHDFFERYFNGGGNCITNEPTNVNGTFYWAGEDVDVASGGTGIVTLDPINVTGYNLELQVLLAIGRPNDFRFEPADEFLIEYNMDGGGWVTFAAFYGDNDGLPQSTGNLIQDADLDGAYDIGGAQINSSDFTDWTFQIPATGNSIEIRFVMGQNAGTEEILVDFLRLNSVIVLPIKLLDFSVRLNDEGKVDIKWQTSQEINNETFTIQRSSDGRSWIDIADVDGSGNTQEIKRYAARDDAPLSGTSYYRLRQKDYNGNTSYSEIRRILIEHQTPNDAVLVYPNPAHGQIIVRGEEEEVATLNVSDLMGREYMPELSLHAVAKGIIRIDVSALSSGLYLIRTQNTVHKVYVRN